MTVRSGPLTLRRRFRCALAEVLAGVVVVDATAWRVCAQERAGSVPVGSADIASVPPAAAVPASADLAPVHVSVPVFPAVPVPVIPVVAPPVFPTVPAPISTRAVPAAPFRSRRAVPVPGLGHRSEHHPPAGTPSGVTRG